MPRLFQLIVTESREGREKGKEVKLKNKFKFNG